MLCTAHVLHQLCSHLWNLFPVRSGLDRSCKSHSKQLSSVLIFWKNFWWSGGQKPFRFAMDNVSYVESYVWDSSSRNGLCSEINHRFSFFDKQSRLNESPSHHCRRVWPPWETSAQFSNPSPGNWPIAARWQYHVMDGLYAESACTCHPAANQMIRWYIDHVMRFGLGAVKRPCSSWNVGLWPDHCPIEMSEIWNILPNVLQNIS